MFFAFNKDNELNNKVCISCGIAKNITDFYSKDSRCKKCKIIYQKERRYNEKDITIKNLQILCNFYEKENNDLKDEIKKLNIEIKKSRRKKQII